MSHIIIKNIDVSKIHVKECINKYRMYYNDLYSIIGLPIHCNGEVIDEKDNFKLYLDDKSYDLILKIQNELKKKIKGYHDFINYDDNGNYLYFSKNYYTNSKLNSDIKDLYLNIKYINKNNYNTIIHII